MRSLLEALTPWVHAPRVWQAKVHEDGRQLGRKPLRASHLTHYPTDEVIDATIRSQLQAAEEAEAAATRSSGHLPPRARPRPRSRCLHARCRRLQALDKLGSLDCSSVVYLTSLRVDRQSLLVNA